MQFLRPKKSGLRMTVLEEFFRCLSSPAGADLKVGAMENAFSLFNDSYKRR